jgi:probable rRNA maturation factor
MAVEVFAADEQLVHSVDVMRWVRLARKVLDAEGVKGDAELSLLFVDLTTMADLNRRFAGEDGPTDVLSFPLDEEPPEPGRFPDAGGSGPGWVPAPPSELPILIGDVVICPEIAHGNASEHGRGPEDEIALLVVHGILHLMGMDHEEPSEAQAMQGRERELLEQFHDSTAGAQP